MPADSGDSALLAAIVDLGIALGLTVIAKGVEDSVQARWLERTHCPSGQGFHYSMPMPQEDVAAILRAGPDEPGTRVPGLAVDVH